jgi:hypothetical protein
MFILNEKEVKGRDRGGSSKADVRKEDIDLIEGKEIRMKKTNVYSVLNPLIEWRNVLLSCLLSRGRKN